MIYLTATLGLGSRSGEGRRIGSAGFMQLLHAAQSDHDSEAAGRLAVLLLCEDLADEANQWLEAAAAGSEPLAVALLYAEPAYQHGLAVEFAFEIVRRRFLVHPRCQAGPQGR